MSAPRSLSGPKAGSIGTALAALLVLVPVSTASAVDCADYRGTPGRIGTFDEFFASVTTVEIVDDWIYYTRAGRADMGVVDATIPSALRVMGRLPLGTVPTSVSRDGDLAVAVGGSKCVVLDLFYPMAPLVAGTLPGLPALSRVQLAGGLAYVTSDVGLQIVDCSDPEVPALAGAVPTAHPLGWIVVDGARAFAAAPDFGLYEFDVADSSAPGVVDSLALPGITGGLELDGGRLFVTSTTGLHIYDAVGTVVLLGVAPEVPSTSRVSVDVDFAYVAGAPGGVRPVDVSDPSSPIGLSPIPVPSADCRLNAAGLVIATGRKVEIWDVDASFFGEPLGVHDQGVAVNGVTPFGDLLVLVEQFGGVQLVDWASPEAMVTRGWQNVADNARMTCVVDSVAFVAAYQGGLEVVDISDPDAPFFLGRAWVPDRAYDVVPRGSHLFLADHRFGLEVLDISDPAEPVFVESVAGFVAVDLELQGDVLFVADLTANASPIFDVSDPATPVQIGMLPAIRPVALASWLGYVYAAHATAAYPGPRLEILRVEDPTNAELSSWIRTDKPSCLLAHERFLYVGTETGKVEIFSIANPALPVPVGTLAVDGPVRSLAAGDHGIVVSTATGRVLVYAPQCPVTRSPTGEGTAPPDHPRPITIAPNPFQGTTEILVSGAPGDARGVTVFDLAGRRVRWLPAPSRSVGRPLRLLWNGRDEAGTPVASGVYFVRLESTGARATERVTLRR